MTPEEEVLGRVVEILERLAIPYMVTGSIAASYHGRPRATHDADVVIDPSPDQAAALVLALGAAGFYVNGAAALQAVRERRQFNAIETRRAAKVGLMSGRPARSAPRSSAGGSASTCRSPGTWRS